MNYNVLRLLGALLLSLLSLQVGWAQEDEKVSVLVLELTDETSVMFQLAEKPTLSFSGQQVMVNAESAQATYPLSEVKDFHFSEVSTGIDAPAANQLVIRYLDNENVQVTGTTARSAALYNTNGQLVGNHAVKDGCVNISLKGCAPGIYLLKLNLTPTIKIIKR